MDNRQVEATLLEIAQILQLNGTNTFKVRAYENAARAIAQLQEDVKLLVKEKRLGKVRGVGKSIQAKVTELVETGQLAYLDEQREGIPLGLFEILNVPGLGPKKVKALWDTLGVTTLEELKTACDEHKIENLKGFGKKTEENIVKGLNTLALSSGRRLRADVLPISRELKALLEGIKGVQQVEVGGSLRRGRETVKDVDLLVASNEPAPVMAAVREHPDVDEVIGSGETKTSVRLKDGLQIDVHVVAPESYACALAYFTGSKAFNVAVRSLALDLGYSLNEYYLRPLDGSQPPALATEQDLFAKLGLAYVPPEMRENTGEVDRAQANDLPTLIEPEDLTGILHVHTTWSDGAHSVEEMVGEAEERGYGYVGISDHSMNAHYANGLDPERIEAQKAEIAAAQAAHPGIRVLHGIEADIMPDGTLDLPDDCLAKLDFVIASVHQNLRQNRDDMTKRLVKALSHPAVKVLGHPQNRKMPKRDMSEFDWEAVLDAAEEHGVAIEVNGHPRRLDADWVHIRRIRNRGIKLCINPDAHSMDALDHGKVHGVTEARRGWATKSDVINTLPTEAFVSEFLGLAAAGPQKAAKKKAPKRKTKKAAKKKAKASKR